jgi:hypothetical protein
MAFPCPRCGDQYTQSLPTAFEAGRGSNPRGWRANRGSCGTPISESQIANRVKSPARRSVAKFVLMLVVVWLFLGFPIVSVFTTALRSAISHTQAAPVSADSLPPAQPISLARTYPKLLADWQSSLICKVCGAVFRPPEAEARSRG